MTPKDIEGIALLLGEAWEDCQGSGLSLFQERFLYENREKKFLDPEKFRAITRIPKPEIAREPK